ncbi:MAG: hypothetical protein COB85_09050, partial [Bacteroidetes bacterium]
MNTSTNTAVLLLLMLTLRVIEVDAQTSGPIQPEFSNFEPVSTTNMVNEFTGSFTWNLPILEIPGPDGSGYALSLSYHSGASPVEEASWVGYGWTLNPGSIIRNTRGFPDDYKGAKITYHTKMPDNWTVSVGRSLGLEAFSIDVSGDAALRYNNYIGFGYTAGVGIGAGGLVNLHYAVTDGEGSWSASVTPAKSLSKFSGKNNQENSSVARNLTSKYARKAEGFTNQYALHSFGNFARATNIQNYTGTSINVSVSAQANPAPLPMGIEGGLTGNFTIQTQEDTDELECYGYMYTSYADSSDMTDYYTEKEQSYDKRDYYLSIPFSNADYFTLSGEGLSGGFRLHNRKPGHFYPNTKKSETYIAQLGVDIMIGTDIGVGVDIGAGYHWLKVGEWTSEGNTEDYEYTNEGDEPCFFRFNNDPGGWLSFGDEDELVQAELEQVKSTRGLKDYEPQIPSNIYKYANNSDEKRNGRASYIAYHTMEEIGKASSYHPDNIPYYPYSRDNAVRQYLDPSSNTDLNDEIAELAVMNQNGLRYVYGLPVYSRNEGNLQYGLYGNSPTVLNNYLAHMDTDIDLDIKLGEERDQPYATTFLLTEINSPDYIDLTMDGPTRDDFGGYVRFVYEMTHGSTANKADTSDWYRWRIPYNGLLYQRNELSDPTDDLGTVNYGEKEVYYLDTIETKTHFAIFHTSDRDDGIEADEEPNAALDNTAMGSTLFNLKKLDKIELYARDENGLAADLIKTVNFEYDYSLMEGQPNSLASTEGKLTLKKVWFDYYGIYNAKISPWEFEYAYKSESEYPEKVRERYEEITSYGSDYLAAEQNPDYNYFNLDRWGSYMINGEERHENLNPWVDQTLNEDDFDPAAWQLKQIQLPSGGEILVQYEQNDYQYVQDKRAMAMVSLNDNSDIANSKFYLNVSDIEVDDTDLEKLKSLIIKELDDLEDKIYFKFLYALIGEDADLSNCSSDFIDGYARIEEVGIDDEGLYIQLYTEDEDEYNTPLYVCYDLVKTQKGGKLTQNSCNATESGLDKNDGAETLVYTLLNKIGTSFFTELTSCLALDLENSFFRIPALHPKKGGGIRVKRLLMLDEGIEEGDASLYGHEYLYMSEDEYGSEISSGVATNEPAEGREENPLINVLAKEPQKWYEKAIAGRDKEQIEGPLGESILPAPSIGYSKTAIKNIHNGKTNTGFKLLEHYTVKDSPMEVEVSTIQEETDILIVPLGIANSYTNNVWATQGYKFVQHEMHGQPKISSIYSGDYEDSDSYILSEKQVYTYYEPGEELDLLYGDYGTKQGR